jgi:hypothetical protein
MDINVINSARPFALVLLLKDSDPSQKKKKKRGKAPGYPSAWDMMQ